MKSKGTRSRKTNDNQQGDFNPDISAIKQSNDYIRSQEAERGIENSQKTRWQRFKAFFQNGRMRFATGIVMLFTGIYQGSRK